MKRLGVTGGVGMGKSACAELLRRRGLQVVDTDDLARQVVKPGAPALREIETAFGVEMVAFDGTLDRKKLGRRVFADDVALKRLESILHPRIRQLWRAQFEAWRRAGEPLAAVIIPLLFETGAAGELDYTICVACSPQTQRQRLRSRGWSDDHIERRIQAQWPTEKKVAAAHYLIWSEGDMDIHAAQLDRILASIRAKDDS